MGIEGRKSAEELKKVSVGTMDGFQMDGDIAKSGVEYGEDAAKTQGSIDKRVDAGKNVIETILYSLPRKGIITITGISGLNKSP
jgi:hypothetical protein